MEYIEEVDDDGLDALLVERNRSEDEEESNQANDEFEDDRNDNILIHRQDPDERLEHSELGGERYSSIDNKSEIDKEISPSNLLTINDDCDTNPNFAIIVDFLDKFAVNGDLGWKKRIFFFLFRGGWSWVEVASFAPFYHLFALW